VRTSWISPNDAYESAVAEFVRRLLSDSEGNAFLEDFRAQLPPLAWFGALNSVSMTLVKFTSPGVPDIYQGQELIELTLVDPDQPARCRLRVAPGSAGTAQETCICRAGKASRACQRAPRDTGGWIGQAVGHLARARASPQAS
jgi:hypothetical protein